jgi:hypothetical protein
MNAQTNSNFFTSNSDDTFINNAYTRTAAVVVGAVAVGAAGYYGYKALKGSTVPALANAAAALGNAAAATATTAAELSHAVASTL